MVQISWKAMDWDGESEQVEDRIQKGGLIQIEKLAADNVWCQSCNFQNVARYIVTDPVGHKEVMCEMCLLEGKFPISKKAYANFKAGAEKAKKFKLIDKPLKKHTPIPAKAKKPWWAPLIFWRKCED
jgi:hypothetical protein